MTTYKRDKDTGRPTRTIMPEPAADALGWCTEQIVCPSCKRSQVSVWPAGCHELECFHCGEIAPVPELEDF
jgi:hypothetical protein